MRQKTSLFALLITLAACHSSPESHYYTLSSSAATKPSNIALERVKIPGLLDRPQIIVKSGTNDVRILEYSRWAEPLDGMIRRVLAEDVGAPVAQSANARKVSVVIDEFDADENGQVTLKASWALQNGRSHLFEKSSSANSQDMDSIVASMSHLLAELAAAIAAGN